MESKKSTTYVYKIEDSAERMDDILDANDNDYEDNKSNIPTRDKLTYKNGYYVDVKIQPVQKSRMYTLEIELKIADEIIKNREKMEVI